jgi:hypothetical protein
MRARVSGFLALGLCALGGCGFGGDDVVTDRVQQPSLLTKQEVERQPKGSPSRTMFEWWRTMQFDNPVLAAGFYRRDLRITPETLERQLRLGAAALGLTRKPRLVEVQEQGQRAVVLVILEDRTTNPNGRVDRLRTARSFNMVRENGEWKLAENMYLERHARAQKKLFAAGVREKQRDRPNRPGRQDNEGSLQP